MKHRKYLNGWMLDSLYWKVSWSFKTVEVWCSCLTAEQQRHTNSTSNTRACSGTSPLAKRINSRPEWASHFPLLLRLKVTYQQPRGHMRARMKTPVFSGDQASQRSTEPVINSSRMWWRNRSWELQRKHESFPWSSNPLWKRALRFTGLLSHCDFPSGEAKTLRY